MCQQKLYLKGTICDISQYMNNGHDEILTQTQIVLKCQHILGMLLLDSKLNVCSPNVSVL